MHEEKMDYFSHIKPVRRQNSDWGDLHIHTCACNYRNVEREKKRAMIKRDGKERRDIQE